MALMGKKGLKRWPCPDDVRDFLPARPVFEEIEHKVISIEDRRENIKRVAALIAGACEGKMINPGTIPNERARAAAHAKEVGK